MGLALLDELGENTAGAFRMDKEYTALGALTRLVIEKVETGALELIEFFLERRWYAEAIVVETAATFLEELRQRSFGIGGLKQLDSSIAMEHSNTHTLAGDIVVFNCIWGAADELAEEFYSGLKLLDNDPDMVKPKHIAIISRAVAFS